MAESYEKSDPNSLTVETDNQSTAIAETKIEKRGENIEKLKHENVERVLPLRDCKRHTPRERKRKKQRMKMW